MNKKIKEEIKAIKGEVKRNGDYGRKDTKD